MPLGFSSTHQRINEVSGVTPLTISPPSSDYSYQGARENQGGAEGETLYGAF